MRGFGDVHSKPGAYYTRELLLSPSTTMKSRPVYYTQVRIIREILRYLKNFGMLAVSEIVSEGLEE